MIKLVLFDIDGVVIDSLEANFKFYKDLLKRVRDIELTLKEYKPYYSYSTKQMLNQFVPGLRKEEVKKWCEHAPQLYNKYYKYVKLKPGIKKLVSQLYKKYRLGVVTGRISVKVLEIFGLKRYFEFFVTACDYEKPKPDPEPLLLALKRSGVAAHNAVYIGDSQDDVLAAKAAGITTIIYSNPKIKGDFNVNDFMEIENLINALQ